MQAQIEAFHMYDATMDGGPRPVPTRTEEQLAHLMAELTEAERQQLQAIETEAN